MPTVLISDQMSPKAAEIFRARGIEVDEITGLSKDELIKIIGNYDGLAIRSATKATKDVIAAAKNLKVIGRAGIGVDNVDIPAASGAGVVVMNTPFGNSITTAEHAIAMMMALARQLPEADASTRASKWEKNRFMGVEVTGKTLGLIVPLAAQVETFRLAQPVGCEVRISHASPYEQVPAQAAAAFDAVGRQLANCDLIVMHCMGYSAAMRDRVAHASGRPTLLSNRMVADALAALLA